MKAVIEIEMNNAAFEDHPASELCRILKEISLRVKQGDSDFTVRDINGNTVGSFNIQE